MTKNTATVFNKFGNAIERNSVNGLSATRLNQGKKAVTAPSLTAPTLDTEWKKSAGILNARKQTNPFPITINSNVRENLIHSLSRTRK